MCVDLRTGPWWPILGLFHTTRGTPAFHTTLPPASCILPISMADSGLWSCVRGRASHTFESGSCNTRVITGLKMNTVECNQPGSQGRFQNLLHDQ